MGPPIEESSRQDLRLIFRAAVAAVDPEKLVVDYLRTETETGTVAASLLLAAARGSTKLLVIGAGKAAAAMAAGCEAELGAHVRGLMIVPDGCGRGLDTIAVAEARHPIPDRRAIGATDRVCELLRSVSSGPILCLLSGGASSLLVQPVPPVTLEDKGRVTELLLAAGVDIAGVNTVRKHLSGVKGGGLLRMTTCRPLSTLLLSDVIGDDPSVIGSGPTTPDPTTFADAEAVLERALIREAVPHSVRDLLARGRNGELQETVKPGDPAARQTCNTVIGSNRTALEAAAAEATLLGYYAIVREAPLAGDTREAARRWYDDVKRELRLRPPGRYCLLAGGETVVKVRGPGKGGRNQELALALVPMIADSSLAILSAGTDGIDGSSNAAGAFVDGTSNRRAKESGLDARAFLRANDSYSFFERLGDLLVCGPTGTNVMDLKIAVISVLSDRSWLLQD
jgi:glycerate-2-kinase